MGRDCARVGSPRPAWVLTVLLMGVMAGPGADAQVKPTDAAGTNKLPTYPIADWTAVPATPTTTVVTVTSVGSCTCDLTGGSCDGNCCCDPDCTVSPVQNTIYLNKAQKPLLTLPLPLPSPCLVARPGRLPSVCCSLG
jgi:hypothetical protein